MESIEASGSRRQVDGLHGLRALQGQEVGTSDWLLVTQAMVDRFAQATGDRQWIHVDPVRARQQSPFGGTIAHGFLTLSLLPSLMASVLTVRGVKMGVNYGTNRVRFTSPVLVGTRIRLRASLLELVEEDGGATSRLTWGVTFEGHGSARPHCVAEALSKYYFA